MQTATAKWYDRRDSVFIEFCVEDSKDVRVCFDKTKLDFSCANGTNNIKHQNTVELYGEIDPKVSESHESKHRRTDRSVLCCLRKAETGKAWSRLTKDKTRMRRVLVSPRDIRCRHTRTPPEVSGEVRVTLSVVPSGLCVPPPDLV
ncbi:prostaglandin E synthase 3-like isoform X3 [Phyllopteryx taeniolatus]|uniref:prostaglandin E synthase 3-like isoform X3 n=1 Tax=Phyllopteryx taeniolatus TaxID=161469 RepID=UPI002AD4692A|nr:prostaglandin E synthase 3-like isoform X3 [Phyllopteryx taeniolatus]